MEVVKGEKFRICKKCGKKIWDSANAITIWID
jgi:hypothetical protein